MSSTKFKTVALIDCNNFFVSCERLFNPALRKKPVVVLSRNDGCVISRSNEAKELGIPMGAPFFEWKEFMEKRGVKVLSSNFALYSDLSSRVMQTLYHFHDEVEIYSVDEAFLFFNEDINVEELKKLRATILKWVGIPVSIGLAPTKTLAKLAAKKAKKMEGGVCALLDEKEREILLSTLPLEEVWGIGRRIATSLKKRGVRSSLALKNKEDIWIRKHFSVELLRTVWELRGIACFFCEEPRAKQSIMTSRSFGEAIFEKEVLEQALLHFTCRGAEKLREDKQLASSLTIFIATSPHKEPYFYNHAHITLEEPTCYTPRLLDAVKRGFIKIFSPNLPYKRGGVLLTELCQAHTYQRDLFVKNPNRKKQKEIMALFDTANEKFGYEILSYASTLTKVRSWRGRKENSSSAYTTSFEELPIIKE